MNTHFLRLLIFILGFVSTAHAQQLELFGIDISNFPEVSADFYAQTVGGELYPSIQKEELTIQENGKAQTILRVENNMTERKECSTVLTCDVSGSMDSTYLALTQKALTFFIHHFPLVSSECALTSFDNLSMVNTDFTQNKATLLSAVQNLKALGGTDYKEAFSNPLTGSLHLAQKGRFKRSILFLTDGRSTLAENQVIEMAKKANISIYCISLDMPMPEELKRISKETQGDYYENIVTEQDLLTLYEKLLFKIQNIEPYKITWKSTENCTSSREIDFTFQRQEILTCKSDYQLFFNNVQSKTTLLTLPYTQNTYFDTTITLTAKHRKTTLTNLSSPTLSVSLKGITLPFVLDVGGTIQLPLRFRLPKKKNVRDKIELQFSNCERLTLKVHVRPAAPSPYVPVKLLSPNGHEEYVAGTTVNITWKNTNQTEFVKLEYSLDRGKNWTLITHKAKGGTYNWKTPLHTTKTALVRVTKNPNGKKRIFQDTIYKNDVNHFFPSGSIDAPIDLKTIDLSRNHCVLQKNKHAILYDFRHHRLVKDLGSYADRTMWLYSHNAQYLKSRVQKKYNVGDVMHNTTYNAAKNYEKGYENQVAKPLGDVTFINDYFRKNISKYRFIQQISASSYSEDKSRAYFSYKKGYYSYLIGIDALSDKILFNHKTSSYQTLSVNGDYLVACQREQLYIIDAYTGHKIQTFHIKQPYSYSSNRNGGFGFFQPGEFFMNDYHNDDITISSYFLNGLSPTKDQSDHVFSLVKPQIKAKDISFGKTRLGSQPELMIPNCIQNDAGLPQDVLKIEIEEGSFSLVSSSKPFTLSPKESTSIEIRFDASKTGNFQCKYTVFTVYDTITKTISGQVYTPDFKLSSTVIHLGKIKLGHSKDINVIDVLKSNGTSLQVDQIELLGPDKKQISCMATKPGSFSFHFKGITRGITSTQLQMRVNQKDTLTILVVGEVIAPVQYVWSGHIFRSDTKEKITDYSMVLYDSESPRDSLINTHIDGFHHVLSHDRHYRYTVHSTGFLPKSNGLSPSIDDTLIQENIYLVPELTHLKKEDVLLVIQLKNSETGQFIPGTISLTNNSSEKQLVKISPDSSHFVANLIVKKGISYHIEATSMGYLPSHCDTAFSVDLTSKLVEVNLFLSPFKTGVMMNLENVLFEQSKPTLLSSSYSTLDLLVNYLKAHPKYKLKLLGHTDNQGSASKNILLSKERVNTIKTYLTSKGIKKKRISGKGFGGTKPIASNAAEKTRKLNRRVEFILVE